MAFGGDTLNFWIARFSLPKIKIMGYWMKLGSHMESDIGGDNVNFSVARFSFPNIMGLEEIRVDEAS